MEKFELVHWLFFLPNAQAPLVVSLPHQTTHPHHLAKPKIQNPHLEESLFCVVN
jgi:hypothetical protein